MGLSSFILHVVNGHRSRRIVLPQEDLGGMKRNQEPYNYREDDKTPSRDTAGFLIDQQQN